MAPLSYARFDHIDSDDDDDDAAQQRAGEQRAGKHSQSMRIIHKLLHRANRGKANAASAGSRGRGSGGVVPQARTLTEPLREWAPQGGAAACPSRTALSWRWRPWRGCGSRAPRGLARTAVARRPSLVASWAPRSASATNSQAASAPPWARHSAPRRARLDSPRRRGRRRWASSLWVAVSPG
mmetsp:Transcript_18473/g.47227  ORF Transcript_18473/g.47227 Transcript_18473/m.47227 type:complete len:182 (-) Transcript_18473:49-594(-)